MTSFAFEEFPRLQHTQLFRIQADLGDDFSSFLSLFSQHSEYLLAEIQQSLTNNDLEQVKISLHSFKGMCGTMGATRAFHLCKHAETMATTEPLTLPQLTAHLATELLALDVAIQHALQNQMDSL